jgi:hypothetical protein
MSMDSQPAFRRKPQRLAPKTDEIVAQIYACKGFLTPCAAALGISRSSLVRMIERSSKLAWACKQAKEGLLDYAEQQLFKRIAAEDTRAIIFALSSPIARARGWGAQGAEFPVDGQMRTTNHFTIELISREQIEAERANRTIEHRADESNRAEDSLVIEREPGDEGA